jgi:hypothetical protein
MSTSVLALGVGFAITAFTLWRGYRRGGWTAVKAELTGQTSRGLRIALGIWGGLYLIFIGVAIYQDHAGLLQALEKSNVRIARIEKATNESEAKLRSELSEAHQEVAVQEAIRNTLDKQNRDQQGTINGCLSQAMKFLTPEPRRITILHLGSAKTVDQLTGIKSILLSNKVITPVRATVICDCDIERMDLGAIGSAQMGGSGQRVAPNSFSAMIQSPAWTPTQPILAEIVVRRNLEDVVKQQPRCFFQIPE